MGTALDPTWEFNAPQFVDFEGPLEDEDEPEQYFDIDHERDMTADESAFATPAETTPNIDTTPSKKSANRPVHVLLAGVLKDENNTPRRSNRLQAQSPQAEKQEGKPAASGSENTSASSKSASVRSRSVEHSKVQRVKLPSKKGPMRASGNIMRAETESEFRVPAVKRQSIRSESSTPDTQSPKAKRLKKSSSVSSMPIPSSIAPQPTEAATRRSMDRPARKQGSGLQRSNSFQSRGRKASINSKTGISIKRESSSTRHTRSRSSSLSRSISTEPSRANTDREITHTAKPKLTIPVTPTVLRREAGIATDQRTAEQRELDEIKRLRKELADKRKKAEESLKATQVSASYMPTRSVQAPTKAEGFHFATDTRIKSQPTENKKEKNFQSMLRHHESNLAANQALKKTIPAPFHLHEDKKRKQTTDEYKSVAEQTIAFAKKTPDRFRSRPAGKGPSPCKAKAGESKLTIPKTPNFGKPRRTRSANVMSQAEKDAKELEEIKKYKFKAHAVNENILKKPSTIPKPPTKEPTQFEEFELGTNRRVKEKQERENNTEEEFVFHANPVPKNILEGTVGVKAKESKALTVPESPAFALKNRIRQFRHPEPEEATASSIARSRPVVQPGIPFQISLDHHSTVAQPFSFETRDKQRQREKEAKIQKILDEEKRLREFHANPLPSDSPDALPNKRAKRHTVPEPFALEVETRGAHKAGEREHRLEEERKCQQEQATFKAKPASSLYKQPFIPKKSTKNLTNYGNQEFELSTERRQERWAELERHRMEREAEFDLHRRLREQRQQEEEEAEVKRLRKEAVHHASGIRHYKNVEIKQSDVPLTLPMTPRFSERLKTRSQPK